MKKITHFIIISSIFSSLILSGGCNDKKSDPVIEEKKIDSVEEKVLDVNEGVKKGFEESKEEIKEGVDDLKRDSI